MAADKKNIVIDACIEVSVQATIILDALNKLEKLKDEIAAHGIDLSDFTTEIEANETIKHCDIATFKNIVNSFSLSMIAAVKGLYDGSPTQQCWGALQIARRVS
jgi:hypothetical protein